MIIPAILEENPADFTHKLVKIKTIPKLERIQVDFCDGDFVPTKSVQIEDLGHIAANDKKTAWEAHLMIREPKDFTFYKTAGFSTIVVHYEAFSNEEQLEEAIDSIRKLGITPAIAINPETPVTVLRYFTDTIKNFTILSVQPGKQGNPFLQNTFERVKELRELAENGIIEVDGGVNSSNAGQLLQAGADYLVVGSALFETENTKKNYQEIESSGTTI